MPEISPQEQQVLLDLVAVWNQYLLLPNRSADHDHDFRRAIHECERIIGVRVAKRVDPEVWGVQSQTQRFFEPPRRHSGKERKIEYVDLEGFSLAEQKGVLKYFNGKFRSKS